MIQPSTRCTAFAGDQRIAAGELRHVAMKAKQAFDAGEQVLVFEDASGQQVELPLELPAAELLRSVSSPALAAESEDDNARPRRPGRPRLGVVAREVTLLPRHWDWLAAQPGGASVALRRLVDEARRVSADADRRRASQEAAYRFMHAIAGAQAGFDEAARALFAGDAARFDALLAHWPDDVREHAQWLASDAFDG